MYVTVTMQLFHSTNHGFPLNRRGGGGMLAKPVSLPISKLIAPHKMICELNCSGGDFRDFIPGSVVGPSTTAAGLIYIEAPTGLTPKPTKKHGLVIWWSMRWRGTFVLLFLYVGSWLLLLLVLTRHLKCRRRRQDMLYCGGDLFLSPQSVSWSWWLGVAYNFHIQIH